MAEDIAKAVESVRHRIDSAFCARNPGPNERKPRLVAVSKTKSVPEILAAYEAGQRHFGENYMDELVSKAPQLPQDIRWHFIGGLQSNKCNQLASVPNLYMWETCSSVKTANRVNNALGQRSTENLPVKVLVQINSSGEENKHGMDPADCIHLINHIRESCPNLDFSGFMTIGQFGRDPEDQPNPDFALLADVRSKVCKELGLDVQDMELSMGMSDDFEHAIELGSTNVRVGSTIFGARNYK